MSTLALWQYPSCSNYRDWIYCNIELEIDKQALQDKAAGFTRVAYAFAASIGSDGSHNPKTYEEAMQRSDAHLWDEATAKELNSLWDMGTFTVVKSLPPRAKAIDLKLVFQIK